MSDFERFDCPACERWECDKCGRSRYYSDKSYEGPNKCANCGSLSGTKRPIRHSSYYIASEHLEDFRQTQMAERDIQRIQSTKPQLSQTQLDQELRNVGLQDVEYPAIISLLEAVGVDVEPAKPAISDTPGDRVWLKSPHAGVYEYLVTEGKRLARLHDGLVLSRSYVVDAFEVVEGPDDA